MAEKIGVTSTKNDLLKAYTEIPANRCYFLFHFC
jgi:hypothetical protein